MYLEEDREEVYNYVGFQNQMGKVLCLESTKDRRVSMANIT